MASMMTINLNRGDAPNLGFRLQGGVDFAQPLLIQKVNGGSPAERAGLQAGDSVIKINNTDVFNLRHKDAQDVIIHAGPAFAITVQRGGSTWRPTVTPTGALNQGSINNISPVTKTSLAAQPQQSIGAIGTGYNNAAAPFQNGTNGNPKLVNKQYNSPIGLYSDKVIAETITAQSEVLSTGAVGVNFKKNEKNYDASKSAVFSMLQEAESEPRDSHSEPLSSIQNPVIKSMYLCNIKEPEVQAVVFDRLEKKRSKSPEPDSGVVTAPLGGLVGLKHVEPPAVKPVAAAPQPQLPPGQNICADCERLIVGVFVRIKDKNLHVECFKCSTCGASLKNVGYYNINQKLYCDIHAKLAAKSNAPGPNLVPVTIPPGGKAPASAISAALSTHSLPSPGPVSPKLGGPLSPSQNITPAPFQHDTLNSAKLLKEIIQAAARKSDASLKPNHNNQFNDTKSDSDLLSSVDSLNLSDTEIKQKLPIKTKDFDEFSVDSIDSVDGFANNNTINVPKPKYPNYFKQNYTNAPRPFSSVAAPLSPNNYSRPLPKTPTQAPPQPTFAPAPAPAPAPVTPGFNQSKPAGGGMFKVEYVENIVWPPIQEDHNLLPTASPLYFIPSTHLHVKVKQLSTNPNHKTRPRPQTPYEQRNKSKLATLATSEVEQHQDHEQFDTDCVTSHTESDSDYQDLEDYSNFLKSMEPRMSLTSNEVYNINGRRSTIECAQALADHLQTAMLVDSVMKNRPKSPPPLSSDAPSAVRKPSLPKPKESPITPVCPLKCQQSCCNECPECPMNKPADLRRLSELERYEEMKARITNNVAQGWESQMLNALRTTPDQPFCPSPDFAQIPTRSPRGPLASAMTIAPPKPFHPIQPTFPVFNTKPVPLPEETVPYLPPERPLIPELQREKPIRKEEPEPRGSPFVEALKTAPQRPFSPIVGTGQPPTPIRPKKKSDPFLKDLPKASEKLTMLAALTTASDRTYSPMTVDYSGGERRTMTYEEKKEEEEAKELKELEEKRRFSIRQPVPQPYIGKMVETFEGSPKTPDTPSDFFPVSAQLRDSNEYHADYQEVKSELNQQITEQQHRALQMQREVQQMQSQVQTSHKVYQQQQYQAEYQEQSQQQEHVCCIHQKECQLAKKREVAKQNEQVILKKPLTLAQSLHKQDQIPSYQSALQYEEQIQLPHHKDIKQLLKPEERSKIVPNPRPLLRAEPHHNMNTPPPKIIAPVSLVNPGEHSPNPKASFQTVNDNFHPPSASISQRLGQSTPSRMNKTPSAIPYYQQNLVATQFLAPEINVFDPSSPAMSRSPSPLPGAKPERDRPNSPFRKQATRPKSPAAGPPPNPLKKHQDREGFIKDQQVENAKGMVTNYIPHHREKYHTVQQREGDYYDQTKVVNYSQNRSQINEANYQQQSQQGRAYQGDTSNRHHVHFEGNAKVDTKEQSASEQLKELNKMQAQSTQVSADGRTKVQRKKTVVEEFEQSHKEKTIEIQKSYPGEKHAAGIPIPYHEEHGLQGVHVTNPKQIHSPFLEHSVQGPPPMPKPPIVAAPIPAPPPPPTYKQVKAPVPSKVPVKPVPPLTSDVLPGVSGANPLPDPIGTGGGRQQGGNVFAPKRGRGVLNVGGLGARVATCGACHSQIRLEHDTYNKHNDANETETEIVYSNDRVEITTTMPPGSEKYYNEINVSIPMPTFAPSLSSESSPRSYVSCNSNPSTDKNDYFTSHTRNNYIETTFPSGNSGNSNDKPMTVHRANKSLTTDHANAQICNVCQKLIRGPFITALGKIWCPEHFVCATQSCRRPLQDIGFVEDGGQLHCEYCFEQYLAPNCAKCGSKIKGDCLKAIQKNFHPECFNCAHCGKLFGNNPFFLEDGLPYCETDWNEMFTTKCFACGFPVEAGDRWVEALSNNYHSQCFNCTMCKKNLEGQSFYAKGGRPFCKNHAR